MNIEDYALGRTTAKWFRKVWNFFAPYGSNRGPNEAERIAFQEWAKHSAEVDRHNSQIKP